MLIRAIVKNIPRDKSLKKSIILKSKFTILTLSFTFLKNTDINIQPVIAGIIIPVMSVDCKYLIPLYYNDNIEIHSCVTKFDGIKMELSYEIYKEGSKEACTKGHTGHCFLNKDMKPFRMKKLYPGLYSKLKEMAV